MTPKASRNIEPKKRLKKVFFFNNFKKSERKSFDSQILELVKVEKNVP